MKTATVAMAAVVLLGLGCGPTASGQGGKPPATASAATPLDTSRSLPATGGSTRLTVVDKSDSGARSIGELEMDAKGYLTVVTDDAEQDLEREVHNLNQVDSLNVEAACPKGSPKYALCSRIIQRGSPDTLFAVKENLTKYEHWTVEAK